MICDSELILDSTMIGKIQINKLMLQIIINLFVINIEAFFLTVPRLIILFGY